MKKIFCVIALLFFSSNLAFSYFEFTANYEKAYYEIICLRFQNARTLIDKEKIAQPDNLISIYLENYIDFLTVFLNENENEFRKLEPKKEIRLSKIVNEKPNSPYYLYLQAELEIQWAFARLKFGEYVKAAYELYKAYTLLEQNILKYPNFKPNVKSMGLMQIITGSIPDKYKWGANLMGFSTDAEEGINDFVNLLKIPPTEYKYIDMEVKVLLSFILMNSGKNDHSAWKYINLNDADYQSLLCRYTKVAECMIKGKNDEAILIFNKPLTNDNYFEFQFLYYLNGLLKLRRLDDDSYVYFEKYMQNFKGFNYIKASNQKLAWYYLIKDDIPKYQYYITLCKENGYENISDDKQAMAEAVSGQIPNKNLLKAGLLSDGSYFEKASECLNAINPSTLSLVKEQVEYTYRWGRILHETGKLDEAISYYNETLNTGSELSYYFAATSAFYLGKIFEAKADIKKAKFYYNMCLSMYNHENKSLIDQKVQRELKRLEASN